MIAEDMIDPDENKQQYKRGHKAGRFHKGLGLRSDSEYYKIISPRKVDNKEVKCSFEDINPLYCKGYANGYEQGPTKTDNLEKMY